MPIPFFLKLWLSNQRFQYHSKLLIQQHKASPRLNNKILHMYVRVLVCMCESCMYACVCVMLWMKSRVLIMLGKYFVTEIHSQAADYTFLKTTFLSFFLLWGGSQRTLWRSQFPPSTICVLGIKLTPTGLAASVLTCRVVSLAPLPILSKDRLGFGLKDIPDSKCVLLL